MKKIIHTFLLLCFTFHLLSCGGKYRGVENTIEELSNNSEISILHWRIVGSFTDTSYASTFLSLPNPIAPLPQELQERALLDTLYTQPKGFFMNLADLYGSESQKVAYALCVVKAKKEEEVAFLIGVDDNVRLWVNNELSLETEGTRRLLKNQIIKKVKLKEGDNYLVAEIENTKEGPWMFRLDIATIEHVRYNALGLEYFNSSSKPAVAWKDSLHILISTPEIIPTTKPCRLEIYDVGEKLVLTRELDIDRELKVDLEPLKQGAYRYLLYTDIDTLDGIFSYGDIEQIYNRENLLNNYKDDEPTFNLLNAYIKRLDHLLTLPRENINHGLSKRIAFCLYKICEIDHRASKNKELLQPITGLQLKTFRSSIDGSDDYYLLYTPKNQNNIPASGRPLMVFVPYVTSGHEFYISSTMLHMERLNYISKFAEKYGVAVLWPSARVYARYNKTPIIKGALEEAIEDVHKVCPIDRQNVLFYGDCSGGLFALLATLQNPDLCSVLALHGPDLQSIALGPGNEHPSVITDDIYGLLDNIVDKPMKIFQSINDESVDYRQSLWLAETLKKKGGYVEYDDLRENTKGNKGNGIAKMIAEQELMRKTFNFFYAHLNREPKPSKRYVSYAAYRDTVYGIHIRDKIASGMASFEYTFSDNMLKINTENIRRFDLDLGYFQISDAKGFKIRLNGKELAPANISQQQDIWKVSVPIKKMRAKNADHQRARPINAVFRERFAVISPDSSDGVTEDIIQAIDSIWKKEYRKNIRIIRESEVPDEIAQGSNLVYIRTSGITDAISSVPDAGFYPTADIDHKKQNLSNFSYAFVASNEEGPLRLLIGGAEGKVSERFLEQIIQQGWQPSMIWNNKIEQPLTSLNYTY